MPAITAKKTPTEEPEYNFNISRKPERVLDENVTHEMIRLYGIKVKYLFSKRKNEDLVFRDFSHFEVHEDYEYIYLKPEDTTNWGGEDVFNSFGFYNEQTADFFISRKDVLKIYPDFESSKHRSDFVNSLLIMPSSTILEITNFEAFTDNIGNLWGYADDPIAYRLTCKVFTPNVADQGVSEIDDTIKLKEGEPGDKGEEPIFEYDEKLDTSEIDEFFESLAENKHEIDQAGTKMSESGGPFGNLS